MKQEKKVERVILRLTKKDKGELKQKATLYTNGNLSKWLRVAILNYIPKRKDLTSI